MIAVVFARCPGRRGGPAACVAAVQHEVGDAVGMAHRVVEAGGGALRDAEQRERRAGSGRVDHRLEVRAQLRSTDRSPTFQSVIPQPRSS